jgi:hypothetical protein
VALPLLDAAARAFGDNAEDHLRLLAAVKAYELRELTAGEAADLAGLTKAGFLLQLGKLGDPDHGMRGEEVEHDVAVARAAYLAGQR